MSPSPVHLMCPHCDAVNRLPRARLRDRGKCGSCHRPLFDGQPAAVDGRRLDRHIATDEIPLLVDFWAPWCGPCRAMAPEFERAARMLEPTVRLLKLDTEAAPDAGQRWGIRSIPTLVLFSGGREVARTSGAMNAPRLAAWLQSQGVATEPA